MVAQAVSTRLAALIGRLTEASDFGKIGVRFILADSVNLK